PSGVITASVSLQDARYRTADRVTQLVDQTLARVTQAPGIVSAAVSLGLPYERLLNLGFRHLDGPEAASPQGRMTSATYVAGDLVGTLRVPHHPPPPPVPRRPTQRDREAHRLRRPGTGHRWRRRRRSGQARMGRQWP